MKLAPLLLAASLIANAVLVAVIVKQPDAAAPAVKLPAATQAALARDKSSDALRAALASGDVAALEKAGIAPDIARQIVLGRALSRFTERMRGLQPGAEGKWWRNRGLGAANQEQLAAIRRELGETMAALLGDDLPGFFGDNSSLAFLSAEKRAALRRITQDYAEMEAKFGAGGIQLPSDRERLKLLRAERDRDIAALLSPAELADYELHTSGAAAAVRSRYGDAIETEEEFRRIVALQKAFDEKFPREAFQGRITPEMVQQRSAAERQLQDDIRAAIGDERYAALRRATDLDLRNVDSLAQRLNLPADTGDRVAALRDNYAAQSQRISADPSLAPQQRREQIQALASGVKAQLASLLGAEAAEAYAPRAPWLSMLQGGIAYSTNQRDAPAGSVGGGGQSVFPVLPAGVNAGAPGATRQVVNIVNTAGGAPDGGGMFFAPATTPRTVENMQVISVGSSNTTNTSTNNGGAAPATNQPAPAPRP